MVPPEKEALADTLGQLGALVAAQQPRGPTALPSAVEDALLIHIAAGLRAVRKAQAAAPDQRYHLGNALAELCAAVALLQEWTGPE